MYFIIKTITGSVISNSVSEQLNLAGDSLQSGHKFLCVVFVAGESPADVGPVLVCQPAGSITGPAQDKSVSQEEVEVVDYSAYLSAEN